MKALSHPARIAVFDYLGSLQARGQESATATEISQHTGLSPSAMSYHLRTLAKAGFIEEAEGRGDKRERAWKLILGSFDLSAEADGPPSAFIAENATVRTMLDHDVKEVRKALDRRLEEQGRGVVSETSFLNRTRLTLTKEQAVEFNKDFQALLNRYDKHPDGNTVPADDEYVFRMISYFYVEFPEEPQR